MASNRSTGPEPLALLGYLLFGVGIAWGVSKLIKSSASQGASRLPSSGNPAAQQALAEFLAGSVEARKIYLFQATMYSFHQTEDFPDGRMNSGTQNLILKINQTVGAMGSTGAVTDEVLRRVFPALVSLTGKPGLMGASVRLVPPLPQSILGAINTEGRRIAQDIPLVQMLPT